MIKLKLNISTYHKMNGVLPAWYYGFAYREWHRAVGVFMIMPLNFLWRWARHIKYTWDKFRAKPNRIYLIISTEKRKSYWQGRKAAENQIDKQVDRILKRLNAMERIEKELSERVRANNEYMANQTELRKNE